MSEKQEYIEVLETIEPSEVKEEVSSFIPTKFKSTGKPIFLNKKDIKGYPEQTKLKGELSKGNTIKLFELSEADTEEQFVSDQYLTQYELVIYSDGKRIYSLRLDANKNLIA